jgi:hypothetical protein
MRSDFVLSVRDDAVRFNQGGRFLRNLLDEPKVLPEGSIWMAIEGGTASSLRGNAENGRLLQFFGARQTRGSLLTPGPPPRWIEGSF